jgi:hypothetical protein
MDVLDLVASGPAPKEIPGDYPQLEASDTTAAPENAARPTSHDSSMTPHAVLDTNRPDTPKLPPSKEATTRSRVQTRCSA